MDRARWPGLAFGAFLLLILGHVAATGLRARGISGLFPAVVGGFGALLALLNLAQLALGRAPAPEGDAPRGAEAAWALGLSVGVPTLYALLLWLLGFWVASGAVLLALPWVLGYRRPFVILAIGAATLVLSDLVFVEVFDMRLPLGLVGEALRESWQAE